MNALRTLRPSLPILVGASVMLTLALGLRQSFGIFMPPLTRDLGIPVSQFTLAIALQNLVWGICQPLAGFWAVRIGFRPLMCGGALLYAAGLALLATAQGMLGVTLGAGVAIGAALACTGSAIALSVASRPVGLALRSTVLGVVSGAGSLGAMIAAPIGQELIQSYGWRAGLFGFFALSLIALPAAWVAGRVDRLPPPPSVLQQEGSARSVLAQALRSGPFVVMALAYFVCGMQLVFLTTHLPSYLEICGMDPMLSAQALGMIGGFNVLGSLFFGWAGGRWNKQLLLGCIYIARSLGLAWYFMALPTPAGTLAFAGLMGFLWLGVSPLVQGSIGERFGLKWQAMLGGVAFMSHQLGSVAGAWGGGVVYDLLGSYDLAWKIGVAVGLAAGIAQAAFALARPAPPPPPSLAPA